MFLDIYHQGQGIWDCVLSVLLDHSEASCVRENAGLLLTNLSSHVNIDVNMQVSIPLCHAPLCLEKVMFVKLFTTKKNNFDFYLQAASTNEYVLQILNEHDFFVQLSNILSCLNLVTPNILLESKDFKYFYTGTYAIFNKFFH